eukprot:s11_g17.t1
MPSEMTEKAFPVPLNSAASELILDLNSESDDTAHQQDRVDSDPAMQGQGAISRPSKRLKPLALSDDCASSEDSEADSCDNSDAGTLEFESDESDACSGDEFTGCDIVLPASPPAVVESQPSGSEFGPQPGGDYAAGPCRGRPASLESGSNESDSQGCVSGSESDASSWGHRGPAVVPPPSFPDDSHAATGTGHGTGTFASGAPGGHPNPPPEGSYGFGRSIVLINPVILQLNAVVGSPASPVGTLTVFK